MFYEGTFRALEKALFICHRRRCLRPSLRERIHNPSRQIVRFLLKNCNARGYKTVLDLDLVGKALAKNQEPFSIFRPSAL